MIRWALVQALHCGLILNYQSIFITVDCCSILAILVYFVMMLDFKPYTFFWQPVAYTLEPVSVQPDISSTCIHIDAVAVHYPSFY